MTQKDERARTTGFRRRWGEKLGVAVAVLLVGWFFSFTVRTAEGFRHDGAGALNYYNLLVEGFLAGHLSLNVEPDPRLSALADPYDPDKNRELRLPDASYYRGKYYIYFGVAPAVTLMLPYALITGKAMPQGVAVLLFCLLGIGAASALWLAIRRRYFPTSAWWMAGLGVLLLGFGTHVLALARRPQLWELPIAASFAFTMLALGGVYWAMHSRRPALILGAAGFSLGLAVASRPTALFASVMFLAPLWLLWRTNGPWRRGLVAVAIGLGAVLLALLCYNQARFDSPFEFGQKYQLTSVYEGRMRHFSLDYVWHNLRLYYFWPVRFNGDWPFVEAQPFPPGPAGYYAGEELYCLAWLFPFIWLAPASLLIGVWRRAETWRPLGAMVAAFSGVYLALGGFMLLFFSATERYMVDFVPALMLLSLCGALVLENVVQKWWLRRGVISIILLAAGVTVVAGGLISFDYHRRSMARTDPVTWRRINQMIQRVTRAGDILQSEPAARRLKVKFKSQPAGTIEILARAGDPPDTGNVLVEHGGRHRLRFAVQDGGGAPVWGDWLDYTAGDSVDIGVQLPALYPVRQPQVGTTFLSADEWRRRGAILLTSGRQKLLAVMAAPTTKGGRALELGGAGFSGQILGKARTSFWPDEDMPTQWAGWVMSGPGPMQAGQRIPLLTTGGPDRSELLMLECVRPGMMRIVHLSAEGIARCSPEFPMNPTGKSTIEIEHEPRWPWSQPEAGDRAVVVWADGRLVWDTKLPWAVCAPDEVVLGRNPSERGGCEKEAIGWTVLPEPTRQPPGGTLRMRVMLPDLPPGAAEPLLALGEIGVADIIALRYVGEGEWCFLFDHWGSPLLEGQRVRLAPGQVHTLLITVPSCTAGAFGQARRGEVVIEADGLTVLRTVTETHGFHPKQYRHGRNEINATTCGTAFTGWLIDARWMEPPAGR